MTRSLSIIAVEVNPGLSIVGTPPVITLGAGYEFTLAPNGGQPPYRWAGSGPLPAGLTFDADTATFEATTVTQAGTFPFTVKLADALRKQITRTINLQSVPLPLTVSGDIADALLDDVAAGGYSSAGGYGAKSYAISAGTFPPGVALNAATGAVTGTFNTLGAYAWTITVTDSLGTTASISDSCSVSNAPLHIVGTFPALLVGIPYDEYLVIAGGSGSNALTGSGVTAGALPAGLTLSIDSGTHLRLVGTVAASSSASITFSVTSTDAQVATASQTLAVDGDPDWAYVALLIPNFGADGSVPVDVGPQALTITQVNSSSTDAVTRTSGTNAPATVFTGGGNYLTISHNAGVCDPGLAPFCIDGQLSIDDVSVERCLLMCAYSWSGTTSYVLENRADTTPGNFRFWAGDGIPIKLQSGGGGIASNTLFYFKVSRTVAVVGGVTTYTTRLQINNTVVATDTSATYIASANNNGLAIGLFKDSLHGGDSPMMGPMPWLRITTGTDRAGQPALTSRPALGP